MATSFEYVVNLKYGEDPYAFFLLEWIDANAVIDYLSATYHRPNRHNVEETMTVGYDEQMHSKGDYILTYGGFSGQMALYFELDEEE